MMIVTKQCSSNHCNSSDHVHIAHRVDHGEDKMSAEQKDGTVGIVGVRVCIQQHEKTSWESAERRGIRKGIYGRTEQEE